MRVQSAPVVLSGSGEKAPAEGYYRKRDTAATLQDVCNQLVSWRVDTKVEAILKQVDRQESRGNAAFPITPSYTRTNRARTAQLGDRDEAYRKKSDKNGPRTNNNFQKLPVKSTKIGGRLSSCNDIELESAVTAAHLPRSVLHANLREERNLTRVLDSMEKNKRDVLHRYRTVRKAQLRSLKTTMTRSSQLSLPLRSKTSHERKSTQGSGSSSGGHDSYNDEEPGPCPPPPTSPVPLVWGCHQKQRLPVRKNTPTGRLARSETKSGQGQMGVSEQEVTSEQTLVRVPSRGHREKQTSIIEPLPAPKGQGQPQGQGHIHHGGHHSDECRVQCRLIRRASQPTGTLPPFKPIYMYPRICVQCERLSQAAIMDLEEDKVREQEEKILGTKNMTYGGLSGAGLWKLIVYQTRRKQRLLSV